MAEQTINEAAPNAAQAGTSAAAAAELQPELLTAYRLMLEYQFFGAVCLIVILGLGLLAIYLMRLDPPILGLVTLAGVLGAFFSALTRLYNVDQASIALISPTVSKLGGRYLLMYSLVPPIIGAIASVVIYVIFIAGLLGDGGIFPLMVCKTPPCDSVLTMLRDFGPKEAPDYGKALVWAFAAGFSERLVPDSIQTLIAKLPKD
jgi:hypothetical protein